MDDSMFGAEELNRILLQNSIVQKTRVWFIGDTGNGKTTTVGKLSAKQHVKGRDGFSHDTKRIDEYNLNYIHKKGSTSVVEDATTISSKKSSSVIYSLVLVDTRGTSDIGVDVHYSARDLFMDMHTYYSYAEASKVVFVLMNRRLQPGQLKMIRDLYSAFQSKFLILITGTMDEDGRSRTELLKLLKMHGITFTGTILAVDWFHHDEDNQEVAEELQPNVVSVRRSKILDAIESLQSVNVRSLVRQGVIVKFLNHVEERCLEMFKIPYAVDGVLFLFAACTIVARGSKIMQSSPRR